MAERQTFSHYLDPDGLFRLCVRILSGAGLPEEQAEVVADNLIQADLRGISSHGVSRMAVYSGRLAEGGLNTDGKVDILCDAPAAMRIDARNNMGAVAGTRAMDLVIDRARSCGIAACTVLNGKPLRIRRILRHDGVPQGHDRPRVVQCAGHHGPPGADEPR